MDAFREALLVMAATHRGKARELLFYCQPDLRFEQKSWFSYPEWARRLYAAAAKEQLDLAEIYERFAERI
jgi:hypothetical protein